MGSTLTNTQPKDTYKSLLKTSDSTELSATAKYVSDGNGNDSPLALSTGAVGIGTASPLAKLQTTTAGTAANEVGLRLNNPNGNVAPTGVDIVFQSGYLTGNNGAAVIRGGRNTAGTDSYITFLTNSGSGLAEVGRWLPTGGLTFNGDTAAANALDDYEEGTWTMSAQPSGSGTITLDSGVDSGYYTKIGRQVTCTGLAEVSSVSSPTGTTVRFGGLPFAIAPRISEYEMRIGGTVTYNGATVVATPFTGTEGATFVNVYINASTVSVGNQFYFSFTYFV